MTANFEQPHQQQLQFIHMSIDKTLRLTDESGSEVLSILDQRLRVTIGSYSKEVQQLPKMTNSHSLKNLKTQSNNISELEYENEVLRLQISNLRKQLKVEKESRAKEVEDLEQQVIKLKKLIEKSYYSLKILQRENIGFKLEYQKTRDAQKKAEDRSSFVEQKMGEMCVYIQNIKANHQKEIKLVWERVAHLQRNLESVVQLLEEEKREEKYRRSQVRTSRVESISTKSFRFN